MATSEQKTILIVDDDPDIIESTRIVLESAGYRVRAAMDGTEAIKSVDEEIPDLIILDIMMANPTEGFHVSYKLRQDCVFRKIPIIIVSAISKKTGFDFAKEKDTDYIQSDEFLNKPVNPQTLLGKVAALLEKSEKEQARP